MIDFLSSLYVNRFFVEPEADQGETAGDHSLSPSLTIEPKKEDSLLARAFTTAAEKHSVHHTPNTEKKTVRAEIEEEIKRYLDLPLQPKEMQPLKYWVERPDCPFKHIQKLIGIFTVQSTNTSSERTNSVGSFVINNRRCSLSGISSEKLIFAKRNSDLIF